MKVFKVLLCAVLMGITGSNFGMKNQEKPKSLVQSFFSSDAFCKFTGVAYGLVGIGTASYAFHKALNSPDGQFWRFVGSLALLWSGSTTALSFYHTPQTYKFSYWNSKFNKQNEKQEILEQLIEKAKNGE